MSRLIVLALPSTLSSEDLAGHFASLDLPVTDARVLHKKDGTSRRMGFIGYRTTEEAQKAKDWFDGTWIQGSRIKVDFAKEIGDVAPPRKRNRQYDAVTDLPPSSSADANLRRSVNSGPEQFEISHAPSSSAEVPDTRPSSTLQSPDSASHLHEMDEAESDAAYLARRMTREVGSTVSQPDANDGATPHTSTSADVSGSLEMSNVQTLDTDPEQRILTTGRLFLRNLAYSVHEGDLRACFAPFGQLSEVNVPHVSSGVSKGIAFITYADARHALAAYRQMDGKAINGRLLHVLPSQSHMSAQPPPSSDDVVAKSFKRKRASQRIDESEQGFNWSSLFMNSSTVLEAVAHRVNMNKSELLESSSSGAAARLALAETFVVQETKDFLAKEGVDVSAFEDKARRRSLTALILKSLPYATKGSTIRSLLQAYGGVERVVVPPVGSVAVVEMNNPEAASKAVKALAYSRLGSAIIYVDRAPEGLWDRPVPQDANAPSEHTAGSPSTSAANSLYVKNLSFGTSQETLQQTFSHLPGYRTARIVTSSQPSSTGGALSRGYGFVEFRDHTSAQAAQSSMEGSMLDGKVLHLQLAGVKSQKGENITSETLGSGDKVVIKNLPFEANRRDLMILLKTFGHVKTLRLPTRSDSRSRGYAFAQFASSDEAKAAINGLKHTHLLGRHLIVELSSS